VSPANPNFDEERKQASHAGLSKKKLKKGGKGRHKSRSGRLKANHKLKSLGREKRSKAYADEPPGAWVHTGD